MPRLSPAVAVLARRDLLGEETDAEEVYAGPIVQALLDLDLEMHAYWRAGPAWWRAPGRDVPNVEATDCGKTVSHQMVTLNALRICAAARRAWRYQGTT